MSSGRNFDTGFSFEVNEGRSQFSFSVNYDEKYDKFIFRVYTATFEWPPGEPMPTLDFGTNLPEEPSPPKEKISNKHETVQTFFISRGRGRIMMNSSFWHAIGEWSKKMLEIEKKIEEERRGQS
jgi:hypothetical protein